MAAQQLAIVEWAAICDLSISIDGAVSPDDWSVLPNLYPKNINPKDSRMIINDSMLKRFINIIMSVYFNFCNKSGRSVQIAILGYKNLNNLAWLVELTVWAYICKSFFIAFR